MFLVFDDSDCALSLLFLVFDDSACALLLSLLFCVLISNLKDSRYQYEKFRCELLIRDELWKKDKMKQEILNENRIENLVWNDWKWDVTWAEERLECDIFNTEWFNELTFWTSWLELIF